MQRQCADCDGPQSADPGPPLKKARGQGMHHPALQPAVDGSGCLGAAIGAPCVLPVAYLACLDGYAGTSAHVAPPAQTQACAAVSTCDPAANKTSHGPGHQPLPPTSSMGCFEADTAGASEAERHAAVQRHLQAVEKRWAPEQPCENVSGRLPPRRNRAGWSSSWPIVQVTAPQR